MVKPLWTDVDRCFEQRLIGDDWALNAAVAAGTVIVADNVLREGHVLQGESDDADARGMRRFVEMLGSEPRVSATALQTVGVKGYDGFALAIVHSPR